MGKLLKDVADVGRYPIDDMEDPAFQKLVTKCRKTLNNDGIVTLPGFLLPSTLNCTVTEVNSTLSSAWYTHTKHNVMLDKGDNAFPDNHVRNRVLPTDVASLAYDRLNEDGHLVSLYKSESFREFLRGVLSQPSLHRLADPLGACSINIFHPGDKHSWHFDESTHSVTIMLQKPTQGGLFRHTKPIRTVGSEDDALFSKIQDHVDRSNDTAATLEFEAGTLSIFAGSKCLHEVTEVKGDVTRLVAVLCYSTKEGVKNTKQTQEMFWGRSIL